MGWPRNTSADASSVLRQCLREMPMWRRWEQIDSLYRSGEDLHLMGLRMRRPHPTPAEIREDFCRNRNTPEVIPLLTPTMPEVREPVIVVVEHVARTLEQMDIPWALTGGWAACFCGRVRFCRDADICIGTPSIDVNGFLDQLGDPFQFLPQRPLSLVHRPDGYRVDLIPIGARSFDHSVLERSLAINITRSWPNRVVRVVAPEDFLLLCLEQAASSYPKVAQPWEDAMDVLWLHGEDKNQADLAEWASQPGNDLNLAYLARWSGPLGVKHLMERAHAALAW